MFQFSDDIDEDLLEDVLSISTNQIIHEQMVVNQNNEPSNSSPVIIRESKKGNDSLFKSNDLDDDDLILSAFASVDNSVIERPKISSVSPSASNAAASRLEIIHSSQVAHSSKDPAYVSSPSHSKHKINLSNEVPVAAKCSKIEYERKFPGPAGLVARKSKEFFFASSEKTVSSMNTSFESHQVDDSLLDSSSWHNLLHDLRLKSSKLEATVKEFTISNVKRFNLVKHISWKIPVFAAVIYNLDSSVCDPSIILKDHSGEIRGTLHKDLWEQYNHLLVVGSALLLRQVSVVSMINSRKLYLNITMNNIVSIYTPPSDDKPPTITHLSEMNESDFSNEIKTCNNSRLADISTGNVTPAKNTCPIVAARSNSDLVHLIKNSNHVQSTKFNSPKVPPSLNSALPDLSSNSVNNVGSPKSNVVSLKSPFMTNTFVESNSSFILNELEGVDADSLFDEF